MMFKQRFFAMAHLCQARLSAFFRQDFFMPAVSVAGGQ